MATNGIGITAIVRDMLVARGFTYKDAADFAELLDARITNVDFLFSYNGTTFTKTYDPVTGLRAMVQPVNEAYLNS